MTASGGRQGGPRNRPIGTGVVLPTHYELEHRRDRRRRGISTWQHPALALVLPDQFISIAEESGLIVPIGQWVRREACRQAKAWHHAGFPRLRLALNVSAVELRWKERVAGVAGMLAQTRFDPRRLELELTETFLMQDSKSTAVVLGAI